MTPSEALHNDVCVSVCAQNKELTRAFNIIEDFVKLYNSNDTVTAYRNKLRLFMRMFSEEGLSTDPCSIGMDNVNYLLSLPISESSKMIYVSILKKFCETMSEPENTALSKMRIKFDIEATNKKTIEYEDYWEIIDRVVQKPAERIALMIGGEFGLRRREICNLKVDSIDGRWLIVRRGKGRKTARLPISDLMMCELSKYLIERGRLVETYGYTGDELIIYYYRKVRPLTYGNLYTWVRKFSIEIGVKTSPHALRSMYITNKFDSGIPPQIVQKLARHKNINDTFKYYRQRDEHLIMAQNVPINRDDPMKNMVEIHTQFAKNKGRL